MNKEQKEVLQSQLNDEEKVLYKLKNIYGHSNALINAKIKEFQADIQAKQAALNLIEDESKKALLQSEIQSKIYQKQYQKALNKQIAAILDNMNSQQYDTIKGHIEDSYESGYLGVMYDLAGQGIPLIMPIDQNQVVKAITNDTKLSKPLYTALGYDVDKLKKAVNSEISRGIATALSYADIARNIQKRSAVAMNKAYRIARTEGHRVQNQAALDAQHKAKDKGADVVKQWDATLDGRTREAHRLLDGQIRELDEPFEVQGLEAMMPGGFGRASQDVNCRCALLQRARWALDEDELEKLREKASFHGLLAGDSKKYGHTKAKDFADFMTKYLEVLKMAAESSATNDWSKAAPRVVTPEEKADIIAFAKEQGINVIDLSQFDGDPELFKAEIKTIGRLKTEYGLTSKITVTSGNFVDDSDFAETVNRTIRFNTKALRNKDVTIENMLTDPIFASTSIEGIAAHEFGHLLATKKGNIGIEIAQGAYYNIYREEIGIDEIVAFISESVSEYAVNRDERLTTFSVRDYKEVIPEVLAKDNSNGDRFTHEFLKLLKGV